MYTKFGENVRERTKNLWFYALECLVLAKFMIPHLACYMHYSPEKGGGKNQTRSRHQPCRIEGHWEGDLVPTRPNWIF